MNAKELSVIWVGPAQGKAYEELRTEIRERGLTIAVATTAEDLPEILRGHAHPIVVACDQETDHQSRAVVDSVGRLMRRVPVFVIVEETDFSDYHYLMNHGVKFYYQLSEGPERISSAVNWAAMSAVA